MSATLRSAPGTTSFATTLAVSFALMVAAVLLVAFGLQAAARVRLEREAVSKSQTATAAVAARQVSGFVRDHLSVLETAAWVGDPADQDQPARRDLLQALLGLRPTFRQLALSATDGSDRVRVFRLPRAAEADVPFTGPALAAARDGREYVSAVYVDPTTSEPQLTIAVPVVDAARERRFALLAQMNLKFMWELVDRLAVGEAGYAYVVDRRGELIAFGDPARVLRNENVSWLKPVDRFIHDPATVRSATVGWYRGLTGSYVVGTYSALDVPEWAVVIEVPWAEAYRETIRDAAVGLVIFVAVTGLAGLVGVRQAKRLSVPLVRLMETAGRVAEGDRALQAPVDGPTETARLAAAFNEMTAQLRASLDGLETEIADRTEAERQVRRLNEQLEGRVAERTAELQAANRELEAFAYSVSHDLRAPLRAIDGYTRILVEDHEAALDEEGRRVSAVVRSEAQRMGRLIDDLLAFSRLGRAPMASVDLEMAPIVRSVFGELTTPAARERIELNVGPLPDGVGDPALIRQVWTNLLSNAVKFSSRRDRASIEVEGWREPDRTVYAVRDNGAGFDPQYGAKLFGVFQRLHTSREFEGTGVGLAIVQRIVLRHGGRAWAEGEPGVGASFYFSLPAAGGGGAVEDGG